MGPRRFLKLLVAVWLALAVSPATAQNAEVGARVAVCVAPARAGEGAREMLALHPRYDCATRQQRFGAGDFFVLAPRLPQGAGTEPRRLRSASLWQRRSTLTILYSDGATVSRVRDDRAAARSLQLGAMFEDPIPVRGVPALAALWKVEGATNIRGIVADPRVATPEQAVRSNLLLGTLYAAFGGLSLALVVYNLSLFVVLRHRFQLAYCAMLVAMAGYAASSSGAVTWWIDIANTDRIRLNYLLLATTGILAVAFARWFFEPRVFRGATGRVAVAVCALLGTAGIAFALLAPWQARLLDALYGGSFLVLMAFTAAVMWRAWRLRSNHLWIFTLAWAAPIAFAAVRVASVFGFVQLSFLLDNSTLASMTVEALMSAIAISYRIRLLMHERDAAMAGEAAARALADTDPLTGLLNRRAFLREAIGGRERRRLVLADIDHFKRINDTLGHDRGDEVLRRFARALQVAAPAPALVARIGGEEFAILAPDDDHAMAQEVLDAVRATRMPYDLTVTASLGSEAAVVASESDWARLYRRADQALLEAKQAGRDRVRWATPALAA